MVLVHVVQVKHGVETSMEMGPVLMKIVMILGFVIKIKKKNGRLPFSYENDCSDC